MAQPAVLPISNIISKKLCVLEIDLEIAAALPDKAAKPKQVLVSKSPKKFASGGVTTVTDSICLGR
ncbi:hypothetical protein FOZ70_18200 [Burkholderia sp. COPS]|uniref:hypothetical protein n=1 Tax=Burkholderia sp. COPS TaxID=2597663 RepID=UPI001CA4B3BF|nr:hypothetical protein [Burkholderia sp. COPS]MBW5806668.1 hypothetical protein [Burkholderia sp. COPS]